VFQIQGGNCPQKKCHEKTFVKSGYSLLIAVFGAALQLRAADKHLIHLITETGLIPGFFHLHGMPDIVAA